MMELESLQEKTRELAPSLCHMSTEQEGSCRQAKNILINHTGTLIWTSSRTVKKKCLLLKLPVYGILSWWLEVF